jgi:hypothetical protein
MTGGVVAELEGDSAIRILSSLSLTSAVLVVRLRSHKKDRGSVFFIIIIYFSGFNTYPHYKKQIFHLPV